MGINCAADLFQSTMVPKLPSIKLAPTLALSHIVPS